MFNCREVDSVRYLRSDLRLECDTERHTAASAFGWFMVFAFPVGLPLLYFVMLFHQRKKLYEADGETASKEVSYLRFFFGEYKPELYFWETIECGRKLLLMGFAAFYQPGTLMQLIAVMSLTVLYIIMITMAFPYANNSDNLLAINGQAMLFLTLSVCNIHICSMLVLITYIY